ncbi:MAG: cold-shock protein [Nitrospiraceae bacterium]
MTKGTALSLLDSDEEVYFHRSAVHEMKFEDLDDGVAVALNVERGEKGLQATTVNPLPVTERYANRGP